MLLFVLKNLLENVFLNSSAESFTWIILLDGQSFSKETHSFEKKQKDAEKIYLSQFVCFDVVKQIKE
jgi:hypothetical protein